jgi:hypothetical protein
LISITADVLIGQGDGEGAIPLGGRVFLVDATPGKSLSRSAIGMLIHGLRPLVAEIGSVVTEHPLRIAVTEVRYHESDFQEEGLAAAISGWAIAEFNLAQREIPVFFSREENRYIFNFSEHYDR